MGLVSTPVLSCMAYFWHRGQIDLLKYIYSYSLSCLNPFHDFPGTHSILQCLPGPVWHDQVLCDMACACPSDFIAYPSSIPGFSSPESLALFSFLKRVTPSPASGLCIFFHSRTVSSDYYGSATFLSSFRSQLKHFLLWEFLDHLITVTPSHLNTLSNCPILCLWEPLTLSDVILFIYLKNWWNISHPRISKASAHHRSPGTQ